jgi:hypothetical protein
LCGREKMKQLLIRLREEEHKFIHEEAEKREISMAGYIRLIVQSYMDNDSTKKEAIGKLWLYSLPLKKRINLLKQIIRKEKRIGPTQLYVEGILEKNPNATAQEIYNAISYRFNVPITPNIRKMVRRLKERFKKRRQAIHDDG